MMNLKENTNGDVDNILDENEQCVQDEESQFPPTRSLAFLFLLAAGLGGLQGIFALIFSNGSAHLRYLGVGNPAQALVWIAGPLAGMTVQPYCGMYSDRCRSGWGRRRPFIALGAMATVVSLLGLSSAERLAAVLVHLRVDNGYSTDTHFKKESAKGLAAYMSVFYIICLNIGLQPLQVGLRALTADMCPRTQQPTATAVTSGVINASNVVHYAVGFLELGRISVLRTLGGDSQFAMLCILMSATLTLSVGLTCLCVREESAGLHDDEIHARSTEVGRSTHPVHSQLRSLPTSSLRLPRQVQQVFKVQFFSWMGWFPFLFYASAYISETYEKNYKNAVRGPSPSVQSRSARMGSLGLMLFALVALVVTLLVSIAHICGRQTADKMGALTRLTPSIRRMWIMSQVLFATCMFSTAFVSSLIGVHILVGVVGISWAVTTWAPYALISVQMVDGAGRGGEARCSMPLMQYDEGSSEGDDQTSVMDVPMEGDDEEDYAEGVGDATERRPGIILGLHNVAIAGPQIVAAAGCSLIFWMLEGSSADSVVWVMQAGGMAALCAAIVAAGLQDEVAEEP